MQKSARLPPGTQPPTQLVHSRPRQVHAPTLHRLWRWSQLEELGSCVPQVAADQQLVHMPGGLRGLTPCTHETGGGGGHAWTSAR